MNNSSHKQSNEISDSLTHHNSEEKNMLGNELLDEVIGYENKTIPTDLDLKTYCYLLKLLDDLLVHIKS